MENLNSNDVNKSIELTQTTDMPDELLEKLLDERKKVITFFDDAKDLVLFGVERKILDPLLNKNDENDENNENTKKLNSKILMSKIKKTYYSGLKLFGLNEYYNLAEGIWNMLYKNTNKYFILSCVGIYSTVNYNLLLSLYYYKYGSLLLNGYDMSKTLYTSLTIQSLSLLYFNYSSIKYSLLGYILYSTKKNGAEFIIEYN
jgi:hypothetical protein